MALPGLLAGGLWIGAGAWPESQFFPKGPGGLEAELLGDGFHLMEGGSCWMKAQTIQGSVHENQATHAAAEFA